LKKSLVDKGRRIEDFTLFDREHKPYAVARFELDNYSRLLSFHLQPLTE
jgi:hypothetical protein